MRLVMTLVVRNEEELLETNLDYHFAQGVDFALVTDHDSTDGTPEILERYARDGLLRVFTERCGGHDQGRRVTRMARIAALEHGADWVINNDADEFWWPQLGSLRDVFTAIPREYGQIEVRRRNFVPRPDDGQPFFRRMLYREAHSLNPSRLPLESKVAHRADPEVQVAAGNHRLLTNGLRPLPATEFELVEIFHMPMRTYEQFARKVVQIGEGYEQLADRAAEDGRDQLKMLDVYRSGRLRDYFERHVHSDEELAAAMDCGMVVLDRRLERFVDRMPVRAPARVGAQGKSSTVRADKAPSGEELPCETRRTDANEVTDEEQDRFASELVARALAGVLELEHARTRIVELEHLLAAEREVVRTREQTWRATLAERDAAAEALRLLRGSRLVRRTRALRSVYYRVRAWR